MEAPILNLCIELEILLVHDTLEWHRLNRYRGTGFKV